MSPEFNDIEDIIKKVRDRLIFVSTEAKGVIRPLEVRLIQIVSQNETNRGRTSTISVVLHAFNFCHLRVKKYRRGI